MSAGMKSAFGPNVSAIGFNGEPADPVTGLYHLGNGYRTYNPALMQFTAPDSMSPFGAGGVNPYVYCAGDPINHTDPTGHFLGFAGTLLGMFSPISLPTQWSFRGIMQAVVQTGANTVMDEATGGLFEVAMPAMRATEAVTIATTEHVVENELEHGASVTITGRIVGQAEGPLVGMEAPREAHEVLFGPLPNYADAQHTRQARPLSQPPMYSTGRAEILRHMHSPPPYGEPPAYRLPPSTRTLPAWSRRGNPSLRADAITDAVRTLHKESWPGVEKFTEESTGVKYYRLDSLRVQLSSEERDILTSAGRGRPAYHTNHGRDFFEVRRPKGGVHRLLRNINRLR